MNNYDLEDKLFDFFDEFPTCAVLRVAAIICEAIGLILLLFPGIVRVFGAALLFVAFAAIVIGDMSRDSE